MRRRLLLLAVPLCLAMPSAAAAKAFKVGNGQNGGIAVDDAGTVYVGWQINTYDPGDAVQFCVLPPKATSCAAAPVVAFPGQGYNRSRVSVLLPAPNVVDVIVPRTNGRGAYSYLARSVDGGRTFGPAVQISGASFSEAVQGPNGSVALVDGPTTTRAGLFGPDGSSAGAEGAQLGPYLEGIFTDIAASGQETLAVGSDAGKSHAFRLPAGGDPNNVAAWQQIDPASGREPEAAGLPGGFAVLLEPIDTLNSNLFVQRLEGTAWSPPVGVFPAVSNNGFALTSNARGRLTALITYSAYHLAYTTSSDGGVLWSSVVEIGDFPEYLGALETATNTRGAGAAVMAESFGAKTVFVTRFTPRSVPVKRRRFGSARVQLRSICDGDGKLSLVVEAARGNRRVSPGSVLRRARFGRTRAARPGFRTRFRSRYTLRRSRARIPVRVIPRRGKARTLRLRVRRC